jgi:hypothetical protein
MKNADALNGNNDTKTQEQPEQQMAPVPLSGDAAAPAVTNEEPELDSTLNTGGGYTAAPEHPKEESFLTPLNAGTLAVGAIGGSMVLGGLIGAMPVLAISGATVAGSGALAKVIEAVNRAKRRRAAIAKFQDEDDKLIASMYFDGYAAAQMPNELATHGRTLDISEVTSRLDNIEKALK